MWGVGLRFRGCKNPCCGLRNETFWNSDKPRPTNQPHFLPQRHSAANMSLLNFGLARRIFQSPVPRFVCQQCVQKQRLPASGRILQLALARSFATATTRPPLSSVSSTISSEGASAASKASGATSRDFPEKSPRYVAYWLLGSAASVFGIVVFGGLTRLTESGYVYSLRFP
jgi:hypothetical protein